MNLSCSIGNFDILETHLPNNSCLRERFFADLIRLFFLTAKSAFLLRANLLLIIAHSGSSKKRLSIALANAAEKAVYIFK